MDDTSITNRDDLGGGMEGEMVDDTCNFIIKIPRKEIFIWVLLAISTYLCTIFCGSTISLNIICKVFFNIPLS
jgi:hypothetical protein